MFFGTAVGAALLGGGCGGGVDEASTSSAGEGGSGSPASAGSSGSTSSSAAAMGSGGHGVGGGQGGEGGGSSEICAVVEDCVKGDACNTPSCDDGVCVYDAADVDDQDACTVDSCEPAAGVMHVPVNVDDANACTDDTCDPAMGIQNTPVVCNDNNLCTNDSCSPNTGCAFAPNAVPTDNNACTDDACNPATGDPVYTPKAIPPDNDLCTTDACDPATGNPVYTPKAVPSDNNGCTTDACDPATGNPAYTPAAAGTCCEHSMCVAGNKLDAAACTYTGANNDCATKVCAADPFCCSDSWDNICAGEAKNPNICPTGLNPTNFTCTCAHSYCVTGVALTATCDPCVKKICEDDSFCCTNSWDSLCVGEVNTICKVPSGAECK